MNQFQSPLEAISACDVACEEAWNSFAEANGIKESIDKGAFVVGKSVFRAGYMNGASYVSNFVIGQMAIGKATRKLTPTTDEPKSTPE